MIEVSDVTFVYPNGVVALKDVTFNVLGPVGDVVEEWVLKGTWIQDATFGDFDF